MWMSDNWLTKVSYINFTEMSANQFQYEAPATVQLRILGPGHLETDLKFWCGLVKLWI